MTSLCIFDAYGKIRSDLDTEQTAIEALPDDQRETLFACIKAVTARDDCAASVIAARAHVRKNEHTYNNAVMVFDQTTLSDNSFAEGGRTPKQVRAKDAQRIANIKAVAAAQKPGYKSHDVASEIEALAKNVAKLEAAHAKLSADKTPNPEAIAKAANALKRARASLEAAQLPIRIKADMDAAGLALTDARAELLSITAEFRTLETKAGLAIDAWRLCQTTPSVEQVQRQYMAASQAERARQVASGEVVIAEKSELDKNLGARGKTATNRTPAYHSPR
jgi:hypothetical protein